MKDPAKQKVFIELVKQHQALLNKVCHLYGSTREDREDLYQEILIQFWKAWPGFRSESSLSTWLYRIALNTAISGLRKKSRSPTVLGTDLDSTALPESSDWKEKEEKIRLLYDSIGQLSDIEKAIVMLYLEDKTYEEMEEILGINQNTLRVKMNRIREKLRQLTQASTYGT